MSSDEIKVLYADEKNLFVNYNSVEETNVIFHIINENEPDSGQTTGMLRLNEVYYHIITEKGLSTGDIISKFVVETLKGSFKMERLGMNCIDYDAITHDDYQEIHFYINKESDEVAHLVDIIDIINSEGFGTIGNFNYRIEFQKLFYIQLD